MSNQRSNILRGASAVSALRPALAARGLAKAYGSTLAVDGIDIEVSRGQCLALLGPNGAGKSTTLLMLAGVLRPDAGYVSIGEAVDPTLPSVRRQIGFVPQNVALYPELTATENLELFARLHGVPSRGVRDRVQFGLELARLTEQRRQRVGRFSGGMQRRLNLATALLHEPEVLLLDEPTVGVDPHSRAHLFECIEGLKRDGMSIVYSTHYMEEAERLCDQIAIMDGGRVLAKGSRAALTERFAQGFSVEAELLPVVTHSELGGAARLSAPSNEPARLVFECRHASEVVRRLSRVDARITGLHVRRPDLETVFLALTGRHLRDS